MLLNTIHIEFLPEREFTVINADITHIVHPNDLGPLLFLNFCNFYFCHIILVSKGFHRFSLTEEIYKLNLKSSHSSIFYIRLKLPVSQCNSMFCIGCIHFKPGNSNSPPDADSIYRTAGILQNRIQTYSD